MGGVKFIKWLFYFLLVSFIVISFFFAIPISVGEIGISSINLAIGDRTFYINDLDPFGAKGYTNYNNTGISFSGGILYPKILEVASFLSDKIFNQGTTSTTWNTIVISFAAFCAVITHKLLYLIGNLVGGKKTGYICILIYTICPYTYYYVLCGGITNYTLLFTTLITYSCVKLFNFKELETHSAYIKELFLLTISLLALSLLRPSGGIFSLIICFGILAQAGFRNWSKLPLKVISAQRLKNTLIIIAISTALISINELFKTRSYSMAAINGSLDYGGTFFGYSRDLLRNKLFLLSSTNNLLDYSKSVLYKIIFMVSDFYAGINDVRDSFSVTGEESLFPFLARVSIGLFYFIPLSTISILGTITFRKKILESGLILPLIASFAGVSTCFFGCSLSRYYFMFITPFIISCALLLNALKLLSEKTKFI
tara:strand:+ start:759 stop:2039 length:1281 start_codon:yes stop_codon:yes gene_type:complete